MVPMSDEPLTVRLEKLLTNDKISPKITSINTDEVRSIIKSEATSPNRKRIRGSDIKVKKEVATSDSEDEPSEEEQNQCGKEKAHTNSQRPPSDLFMKRSRKFKLEQFHIMREILYDHVDNLIETTVKAFSKKVKDEFQEMASWYTRWKFDSNPGKPVNNDLVNDKNGQDSAGISRGECSQDKKNQKDIAKDSPSTLEGRRPVKSEVEMKPLRRKRKFVGSQTNSESDIVWENLSENEWDTAISVISRMKEELFKDWLDKSIDRLFEVFSKEDYISF